MWDGVCHAWWVSCNWGPAFIGGIQLFVYFISQQQGNIMKWGPPFNVGDPIFALFTVYCLPPTLDSFPFFISMKRGPAAVSPLPENNFLQVPLLLLGERKPPQFRRLICQFLCFATCASSVLGRCVLQCAVRSFAREWSLSQSIKIRFWSRYVRGGRVNNRRVAKKRVLLGRRSLKVRQERVVVGGGMMRLKPAWEVHREVWFRDQSLLF